jgi:hypothetical protein
MLVRAVLFLLAFNGFAAFAQDEDADDMVDPNSVIVDREFPKGKNTRELRVLVHKSGQLPGRPYVIEFKELCDKNPETWESIKTGSYCEIAKNSLKYTASKSEMSVSVRDPMTAKEKKATKSKSSCRSEAKLVTFKLESHCQESNLPDTL